MDGFPDLPPCDGSGAYSGQMQLYSKIRDSCRFAVSLLNEEEIDVIRLKTLGDNLEQALGDLGVFYDTDLPLAWVLALQRFASDVLQHVCTTQSALLDQ
jgi:hypothetical protein